LSFGAKALLVLGHPGHELRVLGFLARQRAEVCILTDGGGRAANSRLESSRRTIEEAGGGVGPVFGEWSDRETYRMLLEGDCRPLLAVAGRLASWFESREVSVVASDAWEGFNPTHDLCRTIVDAALRRASRQWRSWAFPLDGPPNAAPPGVSGEPLEVDLAGAELELKMRLALDYQELRSEVSSAFERYGKAAFAREYLWRVDPAWRLTGEAQGVPYYEKVGAERVAHGHYPQVLRFREHFLPVAEALARWAGAESGQR
jgi:hypothetical protein